jgi:rhomboid protease GluP
MDWSLVLISQGIECTIDYCEESGGWGLLIALPEQERALQAIHAYRLENRHWHWRQPVFEPGIFFDWASVGWVLVLVIFFWVGNLRPQFETAGIMDSVAVGHGEWYRVFTAVWLHADTGHLAANATLGVILLGLTMGFYGTGMGLLAAYLAGAGGNLLSWWLAEAHRSLGASGMVMGCLGLLAAQSLSLRRRTSQASKYILSGIIGGLMMFLLLGVTPGTDIRAHLGGFLGGLLIGAGLALIPRLPQRPGLNLASALLFTTLVLVPWALAIRSAAGK